MKFIEIPPWIRLDMWQSDVPGSYVWLASTVAATLLLMIACTSLERQCPKQVTSQSCNLSFMLMTKNENDANDAWDRLLKV